MSEFYKLSLMRLQVPSNQIHLKELSKNKGLAQFPASPTFILALPIISYEKKQKYLEIRNNMLKYKLDDTIIDKRLRPYQNQDVNFLTKIPNKAIFNEQRTGKTPTTLVTLKVLNQNRNIIIAPGATLYNWKREYTKWHGGECIIIEGTPNKRLQMYQESKGTLIMTYGVLKQDILKLLKLKKIDALVVDEAHRFRNFFGIRSKRTTAQTKALMQLGKIAEARYALTGTPAPNHAWDIFGILHFLYPDLFTSYWNFIDYYFEYDEQIINRNGDTVKNISKFKSEAKKQELLEFLELISIQRKRKEVMEWIPSYDLDEIILPPSRLMNKMFNQLQNYYEYGDIICKNQLDLMIKLRLLSCSPKLLGEDELGPKLEYILEYISDYPDKPIIITSMFTSFLEVIAKTIGKLEYDYGLVIGGMNDKTKDMLISQFQQGKFNIIICNLDVIKEGVTLDRAETMIFTDQSLVYTDNIQAMDRPIPVTKEKALLKEGQKIIKLMIAESIDEYINGMLKIKKSSSDIINDYIKSLGGKQ